MLGDGTFCAIYGGATNSIARIQSILAETSSRYEPHGIQIVAKTISMECTQGSGDLYDMLAAATSTCNILDYFVPYVASNPQYDGDVVHMFHGKSQIRIDASGSVIGCAFIGSVDVPVICRNDGYNTGVNDMSWSTGLGKQGRLAAHEIGHNMGGNHVSSTDYIMYKNICSSCLTFGPASVQAFQDTIASAPPGCIDGGSNPAPTNPPPTNPPPTTAPPPTNAPPTNPPPTTAPPPTNAPPTNPPPTCGGNKATCSANADCCSFNCKGGTCRGN